jgi:hypothetical protein
MLRAGVAAATLLRGGTLDLVQDHDPTQQLYFERSRGIRRIEGGGRDRDILLLL